MALISSGELVLADTTPNFSRTAYYASSGLNLVDAFSSYAAIYRAQLWVYVLVNKLAFGTARLPLKVYTRTSKGRDDSRDSPFGQLMRRPNPKHDPFFFWLWTAATFFVYGEAMWAKVRGRDGRPAELWPLHPSNVVLSHGEDNELVYLFQAGSLAAARFSIPARDVVHFKAYNPLTTVRGLSPLEPLRQTLANEDAARRGTTAFWKRGSRPSVALVHPKTLSQPASERLRANWDAVHAGADNTGGTAVLEEGMEPKIISLSAEEAQYIETRKLNREESCGVYDVPPPVVHILDRATFSNITEQMRSMYRDTMAPKLGLFESTMDQQLRPDFDATGDQYAEFLMDEVLRGDFEQRTTAMAQAIQTGQLMPSEARQMENRPFVEGTDRLFVNATIIPMEDVSQHVSPVAPALQPPAPGGEPAPSPAPEDQPPKAFLTAEAARKAAARASRCMSIDEVNPVELVAGLNGCSRRVMALLDQSKAAGDDVATFCALLWALAKEA